MLLLFPTLLPSPKELDIHQKNVATYNYINTESHSYYYCSWKSAYCVQTGVFHNPQCRGSVQTPEPQILDLGRQFRAQL